MTDKEANVDADDRAPLLSFPPKKNSVENAINTESEPAEAGGTRFVYYKTRRDSLYSI